MFTSDLVGEFQSKEDLTWCKVHFDLSPDHIHISFYGKTIINWFPEILVIQFPEKRNSYTKTVIKGILYKAIGAKVIIAQINTDKPYVRINDVDQEAFVNDIYGLHVLFMNYEDLRIRWSDINRSYMVNRHN